MAKKPKTNFEMMEEEARLGYVQRAYLQVTLRQIIHELISSDGSSLAMIMGCLGLFIVFPVFVYAYTNRGWYGETIVEAILLFVCVNLTVFPVGWKCLRKYVLDPRAEAKRLSTREIILEFQRSRIRDVCELAIGKESEFSKTFREDKQLHSKLCVMLSQLEAIVARDSADDIFSNLLNEVRKKKEAMADVCRRKKEYEDRIHAFMKARLEEVRLLEDPLRRLELVREVRALCDQADDAVVNVEASMVQSLMKLAAGFQEMRAQIAKVYEETGIALAVDVAGQNTSFDMRTLEHAIEQYVPAPFEEVRKDS